MPKRSLTLLQKGDKKMDITYDAIELFYKMFFSCYMTGKKSSESNRKIIEKNMVRKSEMNFEEFCKNLQEWEERKEAIISVAKINGKDVIDRDVIARYFGGATHTEVILGDLAKEKITPDGKFYRYTIVNHMLMPVIVEKIAENENLIVGLYKNGNVQLRVMNIIFAESDRVKIEIGKTILCHYPMVIDHSPTKEIISMLLKLQKEDAEFMRAARSFSGTINHADYPFLMMLKKRI